MKAKRLLSLLLAVAMMLSLLPTTVFAVEGDTEPADEYNYVFNSPAHNADDTNRGLNSGIHTIENTVTSVSSGRWGFYGIKTGTGYSTTDKYIQWSSNIGTTPPTEGGSVLVLELEVPDGGVFKPTYNYTRGDNASKVDLYLVKAPETATGAAGALELAKADENAYLGQIDCYEGASAEFDNVELESGNYLLVIAPNGANENWTALQDKYNYLYVDSFNLKREKVYTPVKHTFSFQSPVYDPNTVVIPRATLATYKMANIIGATSDKWEFAGSRYLTDVRLGAEAYAGQYKGLYWHSYTVRATSSVACMNVALDVKAAGKYIPKLTYYGFPSSSKVDIYLIPQSVCGVLPSESADLTGNGTSASSLAAISGLSAENKAKYYLGQYDMYNETRLTKDTITFDEMLLDTEETYYLLLHSVGLNDNHTPMTSGSSTYIEHAITALDLEPIIENEKAVEQEYVTTIASLSSKLPSVSSSAATEIGIQNGSTLRNWTLADWRTTAEDSEGGTYNTLDTSKTDPYAIDIGTTKPTRIYGIYMQAKGLQANFQEGYHNNRTGSNRPYLALRLDVEAGGKYALQMKSDNRITGNGSFDVHFVEAQDGAMDTAMADSVLGTTTPRTADGYYDFSPNGGENGKYYGVKTSAGEDLVVDVKSGGGEYWVVFYWNQNAIDRIPFTDDAKTEYHAIWLSGIKLTPVEEGEEEPEPPAPTDELSKITVSANATTVELGKTATLTTKGTYTVSGEKEITSGVTYTSDSNAVTISGNTVTAVAEGTAKITAAYEGKTSDITITVVDNSPAVATNTYEYKMTFDVLNSENMHITGTNYATADVLRNAHGGALYNKTKMNTKAQFAIGKDGNACEPYDVFKRSETADWGWASSYINTLAITKNHNALLGEFQVSRYGNTSSGFYVLLKLNVPEGGKYTLSFDGNRKDGACAPGIYFKEDDGSALSADKNKDYSKFVGGLVGYANFADTSKTGYVNVGTVEVKKGGGDYYLAIFPTSESKIKSPTSASSQQFELRGIKLTPFVEGDDANELKSIDATIPEYELEIGVSADISVIADYSRTGKEMMTSGVTFTSDKPDVVSVEGTKITTKSSGTATITATVDGTNFTDTFVVEVLAPDPGNAGVIREYRTTWTALQLDKLPVTSDSGLYSSGTYTRSGGLLMNYNLANRHATSTLNANAETVPEWRLMDFSLTAPWDMAYQYSPGGVRIQKASNDLFLNYPVSNYGSSSSTILALRVEVPNKGTYNLAFDSNNVAHGINPAVYFFRDDGTLKSAAAIREYIKTQTPVGYYSFSDTTQKGYKKLAQVEAPRQGEYFIVFVGDAKSKELNPTNTGGYQHLYLKGIRLSAPAGALAKVNMSIESLRTEADPMALFTNKQISYSLADELDVPIDEIDENKLTVTYESSNEDVATVSETGLISSLSNGTTEIKVKVTYDGASAEAKWNLTVAPASRNIAEHLNPHFDTDEWIWMGADNMVNPPAVPKFARSYIATEENGNRAMKFELNPEVGAAGITIFFKNDGHRLVVKPGELYQMTFKFKTDYVVPNGASDFNMYFDIYTYNNATGTASSSIAFGSNRSTDFVTHAQFKEAQNGWTEVVIPLGAPTEYPGDVIYITPRLVMRPTTADSGKLGYGGSFWIDDIDVREVGYAGVEIATTGSAAAGQTLQVQAKPYTTLGHYISLGGGWGTDQAKLSSSDINVIKDFTNLALGNNGLGTNWLNATASMGGKNGTTEVTAAIEVNGIVREGKREITTSGHAMKLLYAEASVEPKTIEAGATGTISHTAYMSDGSVADMTSGIITYKSLTPDVVEVDAEGNVTAKRAGIGRIQANFLLGDAGAAAVAEIRVTDSSKIVSASLAECGSVGYLRDEQLIITGMMESGYAADIDAADIEWVVESDPVGGVSIDENNLIFGEIFGAIATVYAKVTLNGATVETNKIEIEVTETDLRDFIIRFNEAHPTKPKNVTLEEHGWEIDMEQSHSSAVTGGFTTEGYTINTNAEGRSLVIKVDVPYEGAYQIVLRGYYNNYNALDGDIYCDGNYIGTYEYWASGRNATAEPKNLRSLYLTAGVHEFRFVAGASGGRNYHQMIYELRFKALKALPGIADITTAKSEYALIVGDEASLEATLLTTDGYKYNWQQTYAQEADPFASISYESADKNVATVDENGVIKAIAAGETTIRLTAVSGNDTLTKEIHVTVDGSDINVATLDTDRRTFYVTEQIKLGVHATLASGAILDPSKMTVTWKSSDDGVVSFDEDGVMTANAIGNATITATIAYFNEPPFEATAEITVEPDGFAAVEITADSFTISPNGKTAQLTAVAKTGLGKDVDMTGATVEWASSDEAVATVDASGVVTSGNEGSAEITATVTIGEDTVEGVANLSVRAGKVGRTYYTDEMVAAAQENTQKYGWAVSLRKSAVKRADKYLDKMDFLYEMIPGEGLPRTSAIGYRNDPQQWYCRYCGEYLYDTNGHYPYIVDVMNDPWKVQCPSCKRRFPSNDFASLYELGRDEHGIYNIKLAEERNAKLVEETNGEVDYMKNVLYPEIGSENHPSTIVLSEGEDPTRWGVDTGMGYTPGRTYSNGVKEVHTYIGYIMHCGIWYDSVGSGSPGLINRAINDLAEAYMYTGDIKYGRVGAVLVDRIADVYPGYDLRPYLTRFANSDGGAVRGKIIGSIWETYLGQDFIAAYDAFFPAYDDPEVVKYLSQKAKKFNLENDKSTPEKIRRNCEDGILRETYDAVSSAMSMGNTGMHQNSCAMAAVVLDTHPDTDKMIDWVFAYSKSDSTSYNTGGGVNQSLVNSVGRDGQGSESAFGYNRMWVTQLTEVANTLARYPEYNGMSLYEHPKYVGMIQSYPYVTLVRRGVPAVGDGGSAAGYPILPDNDSVMIDSFKYMRDIDYDIAVEIAQHMYFVKGSDLGNLHYDVFTKNPESLKSEVEDIIKEYGEWNYDKSSMLSDYGLAILRSGTLHKATGTSVFRDTQRDFWLYFGGATSHNNHDQLSLGIEAFGIGMTTDLGYPEATGHDPNRAQWMNPTISHNAVVVNETSQTRSAFSHVPLHYDAKDTRVKVLDVDGTPSYTVTDEYRRTIVMVDYDSDVSYGIDFFKVLGGDDHLYSFHANSHTQPTSSLEFEQQVGGTYAGANVPFGNDPWTNVGNNYTLLKYPVGYTWLFDIHRADNPGVSDFWIDYKIDDFRKLSRNTNMDIHLRMTMVNDFIVDEVTLANGMPPRTPANLAAMNHLEYMLVRRKGKDLDTLFTTVIEPYNKERYIESIESVPVTVKDGTPGKSDSAKAVKVKLVDGRTDYVVYTQNNSVTYTIDNLFDFRGFVGVWTINENGDNIYTYVNDGEMIGNETEKVEGLDAALEGRVIDFQQELSFDNWIDVEFDRDVTEEEVADLADRMFVQDRDRLGNSSFVIYGATKTGANTARLDLAGITTIDRYVDAEHEDLGYVYDVEIGAHFTIPMSYEDNQAPIFDELPDNLSTSANSTINVKINAEAQDSDAGVVYSVRQLPRGASFDAETATVTWKPTPNQTGEGLFAIDATDENGRTSTIYFTVTVYGATTGAGSQTPTTPSTPSEPSTPSTPSTPGTSGGGGGGGGGAAPAPSTPSDDKTDVGTDLPGGPSNDDGTTSGDDAKMRFVDLGAHTWAADSINALADEGIIKGTSENTFSPAANITRADFALLLVRAFKLTSENTENFADVAASDYFAPELAIARNTGIVNGIGDNKYAPRNTITRQDMMTIVYRALNSLPLEGKVAPEATDEVSYPDFASVAEYAKDAVKALIASGLVNGKSGKIAPTDYTTRAEVAVLIKRILDYIAK
ncbi:MAG: Ig-like domain-containing protein [Oscillospiraceae bacterium]|nr:Ig-like domain-containing protein [Oscillospiraceae bacterium]